MAKFLLKQVNADLYLSEATKFDKQQFQDDNVKFAFHPYDFYGVCHFNSKEDAESALDNYYIHHSKTVDFALIEVL